MRVIPITIDDVKILHEESLRQFGGEAGILSEGNLQGCCDRQTNIFYGIEQFEGIFQKAAALMECLNKRHIFVDANKRTAIQGVHLFLDQNGWNFKPNNQTIEISLRLARCECDITELEVWIQSCSTPK